jgi:predicted ATPase
MVLDLEAQRIVIVGPSGAGKTTLARRLQRPGTIRYENAVPGTVPAGSWIVCAQNIDYVPLAIRVAAIEIYAYRGVDPARGRVWDHDRVAV